jgi:hypothetical protein
MRREDMDSILKKMETCRDPVEMRRLLQQADSCRVCPEQHLLGEGADECTCMLRFRAELKNRLTNILTNREIPPGRKEIK